MTPHCSLRLMGDLPETPDFPEKHSQSVDLVGGMPGADCRLADYERREIDRHLYKTLREWSEAVNRLEESKERVAVLSRRLQNSYQDFMRRKARERANS